MKCCRVIIQRFRTPFDPAANREIHFELAANHVPTTFERPSIRVRTAFPNSPHTPHEFELRPLAGGFEPCDHSLPQLCPFPESGENGEHK